MTQIKYKRFYLRFIGGTIILALMLTSDSNLVPQDTFSSEIADNPKLIASSATILRLQKVLQRLELLNAYLQHNGSMDPRQARVDMLEAAAERQRLLTDLIESLPGEVLRLALPEGTAARLQDAARRFLEEPLELEGDLQVLCVDLNDPGQSHCLYGLKTDTGELYSLHFAHRPPALLSSERVRAKGLVFRGIKSRETGKTDGAMVLESEASILTLAARGGSKGGNNGGSPAPGPSTLGEQKTLVILVNFEDQLTQPYTIIDAWNAVFGTASNFFLENSYGQTWLSGDVAGWYTIPLSSTVCDVDALASLADNAVKADGVDLSAYQRIIYSFQNACGGVGMGTVGGYPSRAWINGDLDLGVVAHELGHGFGLWHAKSLDCGATTLGADCTVFAYGDPFDVMGNTNAGHFSAFQKERLNWLNYDVSPPITTVTASGTYALAPLEADGTAPKALKILKSTDPSTGKPTWYYLELRRAVGFDAFLVDYPNVLNGVLVHTGSESSGDSSYLLDMTPGSSVLNFRDWSDPALIVGQSFEDPDAGVTLAVDWVSDTDAVVTVLLDPGSIDELIFAVSTDKQSYTQGQTVSIAAQLTAEGSAVADVAVNFAITKPDGSMVTASAATGSDGSAVCKFRLKRQDPPGVYRVSATVANNGLSGSAVTTFTVN